MEGWGEVGEGFGVGDWGTVKKMGVLSNAFFYGIRVLTWRVTPFNLVSIGLFEYSFIRHVLWCVIPN